MYIIGITGGSGAGKTTFARQLLSSLGEEESVIVPLDAYYNDNSHLSVEERKAYNYDHPSSLDYGLIIKHIELMMEGKKIARPDYSYTTGKRDINSVSVIPRKYLIIEGILLCNHDRLRALINSIIFIETSYDERLRRNIIRDTEERQRPANEVMQRFSEVVEPMHLKYTQKAKKYAAIIIDGNKSFKNQVNQVLTHLNNQLC